MSSSEPEYDPVSTNIKNSQMPGSHDKSLPRGGGSLGSVRASFPRVAPPRGEGPRRGGADARAPGFRRHRRHFVSSHNGGRVTAEGGSEAGARGTSQEQGQENQAKAEDLPTPPFCHSPPGSTPKSHAVRAGLLSPTAMARRGGGAGAGGERAGARQGGAGARDRPESRPLAVALRQDAGPA
ncbi:translation initiation factor IF-2-like [Nycticebus coucang]|uniref:translation initiation factor IF-2-like n=1 Tax=Nycticebus coucang TaxID=9470 RepID=UPI00234D1102|nr:translation initiation factor IF-2-like [Nycticebus coucang]